MSTRSEAPVDIGHELRLEVVERGMWVTAEWLRLKDPEDIGPLRAGTSLLSSSLGSLLILT